MKVQASCLECLWKSGTYNTGLTYKVAVKEGEQHSLVTGHRVSVPRKMVRGKQRIIQATP